MVFYRAWFIFVAAFALMFLAVSAHADNRTMSFTHTVEVLPAPGAVIIDGQTDDWDLSAGVWSYNDPTIVDRYSVWTHLMWDDKGVYVLGRFRDESPMKNAASSEDFRLSWRADCMQLRVIFDDHEDDEHQMHINMYYSSTDKKAYMIVDHGGFKSKPPYDATGPDRPDQLEKYGSTMTAHGGKIAFYPWDNGKGYNVEAFWPWSYCRVSGKPLTVGQAFTFGIEAMWGSPDGARLNHRLADGIKDETVNRIFMFRARNGWGKAVLVGQGYRDVTEQQVSLQKSRAKNFVDYDSYGSIPIAYALPDKRDVTIAIDDAEGRRVRNLFGQYPRDGGAVKDLWDGLTDAGEPVTPGRYTAYVLHHEPIRLELFNSLYSSSTPPWITDNGTLLWGSNHGHPTSAATRGDATILYFTGTEGGSGIMRVDDRGKILWADGEEFLDGAIDAKYAYGLSRSAWRQKVLLARYQLKTGRLVPFDDQDKTPNPTLLDSQTISTYASLAAAHGKLWACYPDRGQLQRIDPHTGVVEATMENGGVIAVTDRADQLYGMTADGKVMSLDAEGEPGKTLFTVKDLNNPQRFTADQQAARFAISDSGTNQLVIVDATGQVLHRIGSAYVGDERPAGAFIKTDLIKPMGAAFDAQGRLWIPEGVKSCKRVGLWSPDGALLDQFWGQADYGAMSGYPIVADSTRFIAHGIEFKLDPNPDPWNVKTNEQPLIFHPQLAERSGPVPPGYAHSTRGLVYNYEGRDFACAFPGMNKDLSAFIFRRDDRGVFVKCVEIQLVNRFNEIGTAWVDRNADGKRTDDEVAEVNWKGIYWANGWARPDLTLLSTNGYCVKPNSLNEHGVPNYDFVHMTKLDPWPDFSRSANANGTPVIDSMGNVSNGITYQTADGRSGAYPNPYGRHDAPAARRGLLIAPFRVNGVVEGTPGADSVIALGGDRGEWFLLTIDGLYISSILQDIKSSITLDETLTGPESFGGFFWRDGRTGKVLAQVGGASYRIMEVKGLETLAREVVSLEVSEQQIRDGVKIAHQRQQSEAVEPEALSIASLRRVPDAAPPVMQPLATPLIAGAVDVRVTERGNPAVSWRAALGKTHKELVVAWQVNDASPWQNGESRYTHAFIGGDAVDLKLDVPGRGTIRVLVAPVAGKPSAIYFQNDGDNPDPMTYAVSNNLTNATKIDTVRVLYAAKVDVNVGFSSYTVLLRVPLAELGMDKLNATQMRGLIGVIYSDASGTNRAARLYWHDKNTGMVSDVPTEARLNSDRWGRIDIDARR